MSIPELTTRSLDANWNYARWARELPDDGSRYEVIDGVLYQTTVSSFFHQWVVRHVVQALWFQYDRHINGVPALIVEVLSPSNAEKDTEIKRAAYAQAGVPEYWLVRPAERDVLVLSQPDPNAGLYLQTTPIPAAGELVSPTLPFRAAIAAFFAGSPDETV